MSKIMDYYKITTLVHQYTLQLGEYLFARSKLNPIKTEDKIIFRVNDKTTLTYNNKYFIANDTIKWNLLFYINYHKIGQKNIIYKIDNDKLDVNDILVVQRSFKIPRVTQYVTNNDDIVFLDRIQIVVKQGVDLEDYATFLINDNYEIITQNERVFTIRCGIAEIGLLIGFDKLTVDYEIESLWLMINNEFVMYEKDIMK